MILTLANLLSRGSFPAELPPPFTTTPFAKAVTALGVSLPIDFTKRKHEWCEFTSYIGAQIGSLIQARQSGQTRALQLGESVSKRKESD
jgi:hypothetical protein